MLSNKHSHEIIFTNLYWTAYLRIIIITPVFGPTPFDMNIILIIYRASQKVTALLMLCNTLILPY